MGLVPSKSVLLYFCDPPARNKGDAWGLQGMKAKHIEGWVTEALQLAQLMPRKISLYRWEHQNTEKGIFPVPGPLKHPGCSAGSAAAAAPAPSPPEPAAGRGCLHFIRGSWKP